MYFWSQVPSQSGMSAAGVCREEGRRQKRDLLLMRRHPASQIAADLVAWISKRICPMDTLGRNKRVLSGEGRGRGRERGLWLPPGPRLSHCQSCRMARTGAWGQRTRGHPWRLLACCMASRAHRLRSSGVWAGREVPRVVGAVWQH